MQFRDPHEFIGGGHAWPNRPVAKMFEEVFIQQMKVPRPMRDAAEKGLARLIVASIG
jgi:hypothetical protein